MGAVKNQDAQDIFYATTGITISFPVPHHWPRARCVPGAGDMRRNSTSLGRCIRAHVVEQPDGQFGFLKSEM